MKPSEYCKAQLGYKNIKSSDFIEGYFMNIDCLVLAIYEYKNLGGNKKNDSRNFILYFSVAR